jgi:hypothetical protein
MKHFGFENPEGSVLKNLRAPTGTTFPSGTEEDGELFFRTDLDKLYCWNGSSWSDLASGGLSAVVDDTTPQLGGDLDVNGHQITYGATQVLNIDSTGRAQFGSTTPDLLGAEAGSVTISTGNSGVTSPGATHDDLIIEGSGDSGMLIACPDANIGQIRFGTPGENTGAVIRWDYGTSGANNIFEIGPSAVGASLALMSGNASTKLVIESDGTLNVSNVTDYETLVTDDDDIPNKKYVDDAATLVTTESFYYTATASQTTFTGADNNGDVLSYVVGGVYVYLNGVLLSPDDYTATSGSSVVLDTGATLNDEVTIVSSASSSGALTTANTARKNVLINGAFDIWQRGTSFTPTVGTVNFVADRWLQYTTGAALTYTKITTNTYGRWSLKIAGAASNTACGVYQRVEAGNIDPLVGGPATLSGWVYSSHAQTLGIGLLSANGENDFSSATSRHTTSVSLGAATWTRVEWTVTTLDSNMVNGLQLALTIDGGLGSGEEVRFSLMQLERGDAATEFENRDVGLELLACQRYYEKSYNTDQDPGTITNTGIDHVYISGIANAIHNGGQNAVFRVSKRATPTVTAISGSTGATGKARDLIGGADVTATIAGQGHRGFRWWAAANAARSTMFLGLHWTADAEL